MEKQTLVASISAPLPEQPPGHEWKWESRPGSFASRAQRHSTSLLYPAAGTDSWSQHTQFIAGCYRLFPEGRAIKVSTRMPSLLHLMDWFACIQIAKYLHQAKPNHLYLFCFFSLAQMTGSLGTWWALGKEGYSTQVIFCGYLGMLSFSPKCWHNNLTGILQDPQTISFQIQVLPLSFSHRGFRSTW